MRQLFHIAILLLSAMAGPPCPRHGIKSIALRVELILSGGKLLFQFSYFDGHSFVLAVYFYQV